MINKVMRVKILTWLVAMLLVSFNVAAQDPPDISLIFYIDEQSESGTLVGTVSATDPDGDPLTFSIVSGNDAGAFVISTTTGDLTVTNGSLLDFDTTPSFALMIQADDGNGGVIMAAVTINLNELPLGLDDLGNLIGVYPNPAVGVLHVDLEKFKSPVSEISLYSLEGRHMQIDLSFISTSRVEISLLQIPAGMYILRVGDGEKLEVERRLVVN